MADRKQSEIDALAKTMLAVRDNPVEWVKAMGDDPWEGQQEILTAISQHKNVAVRSCHGIGKDWVAARVALWFLYHHAPSLVLTTGPTDRQVKGILWKEISLAHASADLPGTCLTQRLTLAVDWYAWGFTAPPRDRNKIQGFHEKDILVIVDEASGVTPEVYESLDAVLSSENARKLEIGNPTDPMSNFAKSFKRKGTHKISFSCYQTPNFTEFGIVEADMLTGDWIKKIGDSPLPRPKLVTPHWVAERIEDGWAPGTSLYESRILGNFPSEAPDALMPLHWIERSACELEDNDTERPVELGVDVAREGDDHTVIVLRIGNYAKVIHDVQGFDTMDTVGRCVYYKGLHKATAIKVDSNGVGGGVVDRLKELGEPVLSANAGTKSRFPETYSNARSEWLWLLRQRFENLRISLDPSSVDRLGFELTSFRYKMDSRGRVAMEPKEQTKKRVKRSPDYADALAIAFAELEVEEEDNGFCFV